MFGFGGQHSTFEMDFEARDHASEVMRGIGEHLSRISEMAAGFTLGAIGYEAIGGAVGGIEELGRSLIETNATAEQLTQTLAAIYHSGAEAQQAMGFLTSFAMTAPFTREQIQQAGVTIAALGMDITQVMPALGNLAAVMGADMPTAAQAFMDAFEGRFQMLQRDLHVSKQQLEEYGLQIDKTGKIVQSTFAPAFEAFVAKNYPQGMALQMNTFNGQMSNLIDHLQLIERMAGGPAFDRLKGFIVGLIDYMNAHQGEILGMASAFGQGLAGAMGLAGNAAQTLMQVVPPAIAVVEGVWAGLQGVVQAASGGVNAAVGGITTYLRTVTLPLIQTYLGTMVLWWHDHGQVVTRELGELAGNVHQALIFIGQNLGSVLTAMQGMWEVGWGLFSGVATGALDLVTGHFGQFGTDMNKTFQAVANGAVDIVEGLLEAVVRTLDGLRPHWNDLMHGLFDATKPFQDAMTGIVDDVRFMVMGSFNAIGAFIDAIMNKLHDLPHATFDIPGLGKVSTPQLGYDAQHDMFAQTAAQQAAAKAAVHAQDAEFFRIGYTPDTNLTFGQTEGQAIAALRKRAQQIKDEFAASTTPFVPGSGPTGATAGPTATDAQKAGADAMAAFLAQITALSKTPLRLPAGEDTGALLGKGVTSLPVAGALGLPGLPDAGTATGAAAAQRTALQAILQQAHDQFSLDQVNHASQQTLLKDIGGILGAMKATGASHVAIALEQARDLAAIKSSGKQATSTTTNTSTTLLASTTNVFAPQQAGLGQTIAAFGLPQRDHLAEVVTLLRQQLAAAERRAVRDEQTIALLQQQLTALQQGTQAAAVTAGNTGRLVALAGTPTQRSDPRSAHALVTAGRH